ncbi:hypothetical protein D3C78_1378750 [compost metagenome]
MGKLSPWTVVFLYLIIICGIGFLYTTINTLLVYFKINSNVKEFKTIVVDSYKKELMESYQETIVINVNNEKYELGVESPRPNKGDTVTILHRKGSNIYFVRQNNVSTLVFGVILGFIMTVGPILFLTVLRSWFEIFLSRIISFFYS